MGCLLRFLFVVQVYFGIYSTKRIPAGAEGGCADGDISK